MIAIVDFGYGNIGSIKNMLQKIGENDVILAHTEEELRVADKLILPGVGAFDTGMSLLNQSGMRNELDRQVLELNKPILGICLGMQMLGKGSEEGSLKGLNYISFECRKFSFQDNELKIPHMGWDYVDICATENSLVTNLKNNPRFYFAHSYYVVCEDKIDILMTCEYGICFKVAVS